MNSKLSIYIPTYNRSTKLNKTLKLIESYNHSGISIYILDNDSSDDTQQVIKGFLDNSALNIIYTKNKVNIGLCGNIIRCIENCDTEWIWILSDDDTIIPNCFDVLERYLLSNQIDDVCYINFSTDAMQVRNNDLLLNGLSNFISNIDRFANILFISTCLFNTRLIKPYLSYAYNYSYSFAPHLIPVFAALKANNYNALLSKEKIVHFENVSEKNQKWSYFNLFLGISTMFEISSINDEKTMNQFVKKIIENVFLDKRLLLYIIKYYHDKPFMRKYLFNQIVLRNIFYHPNKNLKLYIKLLFWAIIINSNKLTNMYIKYNKINIGTIDFDINIQPLNNRL